MRGLLADAIGWWALILFLFFGFLLIGGGRAFVAVLRFVLETLNGFGAA